LDFALTIFSGFGIGTHQDCGAASAFSALTNILEALQSASVL